MKVKIALVTALLASTILVGCGEKEDRLPECVTEDAKGPCVWHADQSGNGSGLSFDVDGDGNVRYWGPSDYESYEASR